MEHGLPDLNDVIRRRRSLFTAMAIGAVILAFFMLVGPAEAADDPNASNSSALLIMFAAILGMVALGLPIFVIIGVLAVLAYYLLSADFQGMATLIVLPEEVAKLTDKTELLAIPFFVASGAIMSAGGIATRLVAFARSVVGWMPGGLAVATVGACVFFAAISGSSPVTVIAIGTMMYPALQKAGYDRKFTLGLLSSAGSLGILIPPSIPMLVFALVAAGRQPIDVSELFLAGVLPGLLIGVLLSIYGIIRAPKSSRDEFSFAEVAFRFKDGFWAILLPVIILGGIYSGIFTATEAAAVSVVYALVVELLIHRDISVRRIPDVLAEASVTMGSILIIMSLAVALNMFLVEEQIPNQAVEWIQSMNLSPVGFLLIVNLFLLLVGALMDAISAILIIAPLLTPIAVQLGIDPVHLGVVFIINLEIGYLTPPIGINLFVASSVFRRPLGEVSRGVLPFIGMMACGLLLVTYIPTISLGLVNVWMRDEPFYEPFPTGPEEAGEEGMQAPGGGVGPDGERVQSIEEMMDNVDDTDGEDEDDDEDDDGYYNDDDDDGGDDYYGGDDDDGGDDEEPAKADDGGDDYYGDDDDAEEEPADGETGAAKPAGEVKSLEELMDDADEDEDDEE